MDDFIKAFLDLGKEKYSRGNESKIQYGTAGFREKGYKLNHVIYRMGALAVLRSKVKQATIGVMITASHNPEEDNGVKLVDPYGEMLQASWEQYATTLANASDEDLGSVFRDIISSEQIDFSQKASVFFARDTRPSSIILSQALQNGIEVVGGRFHNYELLTTPQLHYMVRCKNTNGAYGMATEEGYYEKLAEAFTKLKQMPKIKKARKEDSYSAVIHVDAANGVGAPKVKLLQKYISDSLNVILYKDGSQGKLNHECGADFVKVQQRAPTGLELSAGDRWASFDGDADRIVFYYSDSVGKFHLLDGDKIATLVAGYLKDLVEQSGLSLNMGLVQTAYANGSSTDYITNQMKVPVACVPTGVKHLHHKALEYDVGIYFEANGHGTVLFSDEAMDRIAKATADSSLSEQQKASAQQLSVVLDLINQTVGDAISDMLLVETVLYSLDWSIEDWNQAYMDLPNRQLKVKVKDRSVIQTADAERKAIKPDGLQNKIDEIVSRYKKGRSFVRPSGTEDVVRVYAEAESRQSADDLAQEVSVAVYDMAGGIGERPTSTS